PNLLVVFHRFHLLRTSGTHRTEVTLLVGYFSLIFSCPGGLLLFYKKHIHIREIATGTDIALMEHGGVVNHVAFSPDGRYVASGSNDATARVWEAATGKEVARMTHDDDVFSVDFSSDGQYVVSGSHDATARVWEAATGKEVARKTHDDIVVSVAFSPDGKYVVSDSEDATARVWEAATGIEIARMEHDDTVGSVEFSPNGGRYVVSGSADFTARVWEATTGTEIARMTHDATVTSVAFSPNSDQVVSGSFDTTARVWEAATGTEIARMTHDNALSSVDFSPDGKYVKSIEFGSVYETLWEAANGIEIIHVKHDDFIDWAALSPDDNYLVSGSGDNIARVWDIKTDTEVSEVTHDYVVWSVDFSPDGEYIVSAGDDTARVWEASSGTELAHMDHDVYVYTAVFSPDGKYVVSGGCDQRDPISQNCVQGSARVWSAKTGKEIARMVHNSQVYRVAFSPDGKYVVSGGCDQYDQVSQICDEGSARVWSTETGNEVARMVHEGTVRVVAFSPDGKHIVSGSDDETARVWNALTGKEISRMRHWAGPITDSTINLNPNQGTVRAVAFSPDGNHVAPGGCDHRDAITVLCTRAIARVWQTATGQEVAHMEHAGQVNSIALSRDGLYIVSGSWDGTARVWDAKIGVEVARMTYNGAVTFVDFSPDGRSIISAGCDKPETDNTCSQASVRMWRWNSEDLIKDACSRVTRNFTRTEWAQYFGNGLPYQAICPNLPIETEATTIP
ncbi:MAG TPA: WD40 repeat domain-containing protein, partial [Anaerolineales bacterium]|nr:WD40 repeat domain-containing protein [Anaerolineales bacterium]